MPTVSIGNIDKRVNSTKQTFSSVFSADCKLKEPCSMEGPVFIVQGLSKGAFYNYAQFEGRYFWIDDIVYITRDIQEVHCHLDPLATYKNDIKNTFAYVQYADKAHWNKWVDDLRVQPEKEDTSLSTSETKNVFTGSETGCVIMSYYDMGAQHGITHAALEVSSFMNMLADLDDILSGLTMDQMVAKLGGIGSWADMIIDCRWVPFSVSSVGGSSGAITVTLGTISCSAVGAYISPIVRQNHQASWQLDWSFAYDHPYLKHSRWTSYQFATPFGYCEIPIDCVVNQSNLYLQTSVIKTTGDMTITLWENGYGDGQLLAAFSGNISYNLMGEINNGGNIRDAFGNALGFGAKLGLGAATLGMSIGAGQLAVSQAQQNYNLAKTTGDTSGRISASQSLASAQSHLNRSTFSAGVDLAQCVPSTTNVGAPSGSIGGSLSTVWLTGEFAKARLTRKVFVPNDKAGYGNFCDMYGYPCNQYMNLSTINGYCKCSGAVVEAEGASQSSLASLNSMLNAGIFIE